MEAQARAGVSVDGSTLRYAEVEHYGAHRRLLRLGSCAFDFDVMEQVLQSKAPANLKTVGEALRDVFAGSVAAELRVALHPPSCCTFFTPLPADLPERDGRQRLKREAALLMGVKLHAPLHLQADALYAETLGDGSAVEWFHVLALPGATRTRFDGLLRDLPPKQYRFGSSMKGAAAVAARTEPPGTQKPDAGKPLVVAVGWYATHIEYALLHEGTWRFGYHTAPGSPADAVFFTVALLQRIKRKPEEVQRICVYGADVEMERFEAFRHVFGRPPERMNPLDAVEVDAGEAGTPPLAAQFGAEAYAPCIGLAL